MNLEWAKQKSEQANALLNQALQQSSNTELIGEAIAIYQQVIQSDIKLAAPYLGIAWLAFSAGQYQHARVLLQTALELEPGNLDVVRLQQRFESLNQNQIETAFPIETEVDSLRSYLPPEHHPVDIPSHQDTPTSARAQSIKQIETLAESDPTKITKILGPIQSGMTHQGPQVRLLQQWLKKLGHTQVQLTGHYDQATLNASQAFQMKHKLKISGLIDKATAHVLHRLITQALPQTKLQPAKSETISANETQLLIDLGLDSKKYCARGPQVLILQQALLSLGYQAPVHSQYDKATSMAVRAFQSQHKLAITGIVDGACRLLINHSLSQQAAQQALIDEILNCLETQQSSELKLLAQRLESISALLTRWCNPENKSFNSSSHSKPDSESVVLYREISEFLGTPGQSGVISQGESVLRCQEILLEKGYSVKANGHFDLQTFTELKRFQSDHHLEANGYVDPPTRTLLNQRLKEQIAKQTICQAMEAILLLFAESNNLKRDPALTAKHILDLAQGQDFAQVLKSALPIKSLSAELGPAGRAQVINSGPEVELLQIWMQSEAPLTITGKYDADTFKAVRQFQLKHKIPMTGIVDGTTRQLLNAHFNEE